MLKKNGLSSVGAVMLQRIPVEQRRPAAAGAVSRANSSSAHRRGLKHDLEPEIRATTAFERSSSPRMNGRRLTSSVPTPSGRLPAVRQLHVADDREVRAGLVDAEALQRGRPPASRAVDLRRAVADSTSARRSAARRRQVPQEDRPRLGGVDRVLAQHERARCGRRPGVDERDLDQVEAIAAPRDVAARLVVHEAHAGIAIEMAGEVAEAAVDRARMSWLISTAVTDRAPKASADSTSRPPPAPIDQRVGRRAHAVARGS